MKRSFLLLIILILFFVASQLGPKAGYTIEQFGFGSGLFHGILSFFTFFGGYFSKSIVVMARNHTLLYSVGFYLSAIISWAIAIILIFTALFSSE